MPDPIRGLPHRRTAVEAVAQANAKERLRTARWVRGASGALFFGGLSALGRRYTWWPSHQVLGVHVHGGPTFTLSLEAILGLLAIAISPIVFAVGNVLLTRATRAIASDPVTAVVLSEPIT